MTEQRISYQDFTPDLRQPRRIVYVLDDNNVAHQELVVYENQNRRSIPLLIFIFLICTCLILLLSYLLTNWNELDNIS